MSSPRKSLSTSEAQRLLDETFAPKLITPVLYYFRGQNNLQFFGHVAIGGVTDEKTKRNLYLSYGLPSDEFKSNPVNLVKDDRYSSTLFSESEFYGEYFEIKLPACDVSDVQKAIENFRNLDRNKYSIIGNNCANAVIDFLKDVHVLTKEEKFAPGLRPAEVAKLVCNLRLSVVNIDRDYLHKNNTMNKWDKVVKLLKNDTERLVLEEFRDEVDTKRRLKSTESKKDKQGKMKQIVEACDIAASNSDYNKAFMAILNGFHSIQDGTLTKSRTKKTLAYCIEEFPSELLSISGNNLNFITTVKKMVDTFEFNEKENSGLFKRNPKSKAVAELQAIFKSDKDPDGSDAKKAYKQIFAIKDVLERSIASDKKDYAQTFCETWHKVLTGLLAENNQVTNTATTKKIDDSPGSSVNSRNSNSSDEGSYTSKLSK